MKTQPQKPRNPRRTAGGPIPPDLFDPVVMTVPPDSEVRIGIEPRQAGAVVTVSETLDVGGGRQTRSFSFPVLRGPRYKCDLLILNPSDYVPETWRKR